MATSVTHFKNMSRPTRLSQIPFGAFKGTKNEGKRKLRDPKTSCTVCGHQCESYFLSKKAIFKEKLKIRFVLILIKAFVHLIYKKQK